MNTQSAAEPEILISVLKDSSSPSRAEKIFWIFFLSAACLVLGCLGVFSTPFFRDYSIVFEGGYRVMLGQVPYRDFYIPMGPVTFYIQGLFNLIFGANLWASGLHSGFLAAVVSSLLYLLANPKLGSKTAAFFSLLSFFAFTGVINFPWYNTGAYFFLLLNTLLLISVYDRPRLETKTCVLSAVLTALGLFSKQDTGILHFLSLNLFFLFHYRTDFKRWLLGYTGLTLVISAAAILGFQSVGNFTYWFNYGQPPHSSKLGDFFAARPLTHWRLYAVLVLGVCQFIPQLGAPVRKRLFVLAMLMGVTFVTAYTSGRPAQTWLNGSIVSLFIGYDLMLRLPGVPQKHFSFYRNALRVLLLLGGISAVHPFSLTGRYLTGTVLMQPQFENVSWAQKLKNYYGLTGMAVIQEGSYKHGLIPQEYVADLQTLKNSIKEYDSNFLNMTEYAFLYADFKVEPPKGVPLWFHQGTSYFDQDVNNFKDYIFSHKPNLILLQDPHTNKWRPLKIHLFYYFVDVGYHKLYHVTAPAVARIDVLAYPKK